MATALEPGQKTFALNTPPPAGGTPAATPAVGLNRRVIQLTSAQLLALLTTPVTLLPAPGVGFMNVPVAIKIDMQAGAAAYTDVGGAISFVQGSMSVALAANTVFLAGANFRAHQIVDFAALDTAAAAPTDENAALTISKVTNNLAAGNGTALITIYYLVEAIAPTPS